MFLYVLWDRFCIGSESYVRYRCVDLHDHVAKAHLNKSALCSIPYTSICRLLSLPRKHDRPRSLPWYRRPAADERRRCPEQQRLLCRPRTCSVKGTQDRTFHTVLHTYTLPLLQVTLIPSPLSEKSRPLSTISNLSGFFSTKVTGLFC